MWNKHSQGQFKLNLIQNFRFELLIIAQQTVEKMQKSKILHRSRSKETFSRTRQALGSLEPQSKQLDLKHYQKFMKFMTRNRLQNLKQKMASFYGRNFPINYHKKYNFLQEWQGLQRKQQKNLYELIQSENTIVQFICLLIMLTNTFIVWNISVKRVFRDQRQQSQLYPLTMVVGLINRLISVSLRFYLEKISGQNTLTTRLIIQILAKDLISSIYFIIGMFNIAYNNPIMMMLQLFLSFDLYLQANQYYKFLRIIELSLIYEYQFKIIDLMINLFIITHLLSIFLFLGTLYDETNNWILAIKADNDGYLGKYLYSLYFCCTTILTIGYGDISPKNKLQIFIVIVVQLFGVIIFGYLINEIGHNQSIMRKNQQNLQKDLTVLKKIQNFYNLQSRLVNQAKGYLITNRNALVQLTPEQQKDLLSKLNQQLRTVIINQKSLSIVKTSIFFLCRWSKQMQNNVASKLQKALYLPNQRLLQPPSKQRIYIIKRGKIDIYCDRYGHNRRQYRRLMKSIKIKEGNSINQNIYGYTAVISLRPCSLDAISSQFTSCYYIEKDAFLKCVYNQQSDFQYYYEIKCKIDQSQFCEAYEAPSILNIRQHYNPSRTILIRKTNAQMSKTKNLREVFVRSQKRNVKKHHFKNMLKIVQQINDKLIINSNEFIELSIFNRNDIHDDSQITDKQKSSKSIQEVIKQSRNKKSLTVIGTLDNHQSNTLISESKPDILPNMVKKSLHHYFQRSQQYKNFFKCNNLSEVIKRLQNENYNFNEAEEPFYSIKVSTNKLFNFNFNQHQKLS